MRNFLANNPVLKRSRLCAGVFLLVAWSPALPAEEVAGHGAFAAKLQPFVDEHYVSGGVALVADAGRVLDVTTVGRSSLSTKAPLREDSVFWIASISKTFVATAMMMLVDEGKVNVDDPVEKYLPEFKGQLVADKKGNHPPRHPMRVKELLTHTSGIIGPNDPPIQKHNDLADDIRQYASAPLKWEPGTKFEYNNAGINTAGRIIEVVSGMAYGDFIRQRLLEPLGMSETTFWPGEKLAARLAQTSQWNKEKSVLEDVPNKPDKAWLEQKQVPLPMRMYLGGEALRAYPNRYAWPAGGLFSTAGDLAKYGQAMLRGSVVNGKRLVSEASFQRMTTLEPCMEGIQPAPGIGLGWFVTKNDSDGVPLGCFGHHGARGPVLWVDPVNKLVLILLYESMDLQTRGDAKRRIEKAFFQAALEKYGKPAP
ncbi:serine hydrolase domain-containing protein [Prosthecobacter sp.]|uniref:serine hydrolase domain-containing protein n=1 Tax=Prosthecobacter sp. TaxID=1965333 RepID=UPI0037839C94